MKTGSPSEGVEKEYHANDEPSIFVKILEKCRNGATREELRNAIPLLSHSNLQFRRSTAELVDRRLLIYDEKRHAFITTDKGIIFLNSTKKTR